eukprot:15462663-Alexandrium_andersonii.AAC.1
MDNNRQRHMKYMMDLESTLAPHPSGQSLEESLSGCVGPLMSLTRTVGQAIVPNACVFACCVHLFSLVCGCVGLPMGLTGTKRAST